LSIGLILAFGLSAPAQEAPPDLARRVAARETVTEAERNQYTYHQTVAIEELDNRGAVTGSYHEARDVIFSPTHERTERMIGRPENRLRSLVLTPEDFRDVREVQPLVLSTERLWLYETKFRGEETVEGVDCWLLQIRPRQILQGQRLFDGMLWVDKKDLNIVRMEGQAVPQILTTKSENLFPRFTTIRQPVDGRHWFPSVTLADDVLHFRGGPVRERLRIRYSEYKRFGAESTVTFKP
jgi:hypothetical protein